LIRHNRMSQCRRKAVARLLASGARRAYVYRGGPSSGESSLPSPCDAGFQPKSARKCSAFQPASPVSGCRECSPSAKRKPVVERFEARLIVDSERDRMHGMCCIASGRCCCRSRNQAWQRQPRPRARQSQIMRGKSSGRKANHARFGGKLINASEADLGIPQVRVALN